MAGWDSWSGNREAHPRLLSKRCCLAHYSAAFAAIVVALAPLPASGRISRTGFQNEYYQGLNYNGSRLLEQQEADRYEEYLKVTWTQAVQVDASGRVWVVDRNNHVVVEMPPTTRYIQWAALYYDYAGTRGMPGFMDGSRGQVRFDSPTGIAVTVSMDPLYIYVSDTNNHVIRKIDTVYERVSTVVGLANSAGLRDGPAKDARLRFPMSLGLDIGAENLMVLDNGNRIRHVRVNLIVPTITTLIDGACRSILRYTLLTSIEIREVGCHTDWLASDMGDTKMTKYTYNTICLGHKATCGPRHHPALQDRWSPQLIPAPATTTSSTTLYNRVTAIIR